MNETKSKIERKVETYCSKHANKYNFSIPIKAEFCVTDTGNVSSRYY